MTDNEMRIAIAEACGYSGDDEKLWFEAPNGISVPRHALPDYLNDLNAMHEAEKTLKNNSSFQIGCQGMYINILNDMCGSHFFPTIHATARQRAEAFLRCLGKWRD